MLSFYHNYEGVKRTISKPNCKFILHTVNTSEKFRLYIFQSLLTTYSFFNYNSFPKSTKAERFPLFSVAIVSLVKLY